MTLNMDTTLDEQKCQGNSEEKKNSKKEEKENFIQKTGIESEVEREKHIVTGGYLCDRKKLIGTKTNERKRLKLQNRFII